MGDTEKKKASSTDWKADFFGGLNDLPAEPVQLLSRVLTVMGTEPTFVRARREMLDGLALTAGSRVLDAGCGNGAALPDLAQRMGLGAQITGIDPTRPFLEEARQRADRLGVTGSVYLTGDVRDLPFSDESFDAAFCDKILIHVGPPSAVLGELYRVTRSGGRVGAVEWQPQFSLSTSRADLEPRFQHVFRQTMLDFCAGPNLARYFREAGFADVTTRVYLAATDTLSGDPFWRTFLLDQMPLFVHTELISEAQAQDLVQDFEMLESHSDFRAAFIVWTAVGTRP